MVRRLLELVGLARRPDDDWARLADRQDRRPRPVDPALRDRALALHQHLTRFLHASDPWMLRHAGVADTDLPPGTEWHWRPGLLRGRIIPAAVAEPPSGHRLGQDAALWHDCPNRALILRQSARPQPEGRHALGIEVLGFAGSFLSLTLDLPGAMLDGVDAERILQLDMVGDAERPIRLYARINLVQGPNTEAMLRELGHPVAGQDNLRRVEFDLAYANLANRPVERAWLDLILESPRMNALAIRDIRLSCRPRARI